MRVNHCENKIEEVHSSHIWELLGFKLYFLSHYSARSSSTSFPQTYITQLPLNLLLTLLKSISSFLCSQLPYQPTQPIAFLTSFFPLRPTKLLQLSPSSCFSSKPPPTVSYCLPFSPLSPFKNVSILTITMPRQQCNFLTCLLQPTHFYRSSPTPFCREGVTIL